MSLINVLKPQPSEIYCIYSGGRPKRELRGDSTNNSILVLYPWENYTTETALPIDEVIPSPYAKVPFFEVMHGNSTYQTSEPLNAIRKTQGTITIRFIITDFLQYSKTIKTRSRLANIIHPPLVTKAEQECIKNPLSYNYENIRDIDDALLSKANEITKDFGIDVQYCNLKLKLSEESNSLMHNFSKNRLDAVNVSELEIAINYAKGEGLQKLARSLSIDDTALVYKLDTLSRMFQNGKFNFNALSDTDKDFTQRLISFFHSSN